MEQTLGKNIAKHRKALGLTQDQLAEQLGVTAQAVSKWENDTSAPDTLRLIQLADALDTDVEYLATGNHSIIKAAPQVVPVYRNVDRVVEVEKIIEKPVIVEKVVEVEKIVESVVEKPVLRKVTRTKYLRNPLEFAAVALIFFILGLLSGYLFF